MTDFALWEKELREDAGLTHTKPKDLAFKTLKLSLENIEPFDELINDFIDIIEDLDPSNEEYQFDHDREYEISSNDFAIVDYIVYIYYLSALFLDESEPKSFVEEYDDFFQRLLIFFAITELNLSKEDAKKLLKTRIEKYDNLLSENPDRFLHFLQISIDELMVYLERDSLKDPFSDEYPIVSIFKNFRLRFNIKQHIIDMSGKLLDIQDEFTNKDLEVNTESPQGQIEKFKATQNQSPQPKKKRRRGLFSSRVSAIISIILCIVMYWTLLTTVYTTKVDTYICYITETGDCYHAANCRYLWNSAQQTTVYEVLGEYRSCSYCNPKVDKYETRITKKNYKAPFFISAPISIVLYFVIKKDD